MNKMFYNGALAALFAIANNCAGSDVPSQSKESNLDAPQSQVAQSQTPSFFSRDYWFPSSEERHIVEFETCQKFMADFGNLEAESYKREKVQQDYLHKTSKEIDSAKGKYTDEKQLSKLATLQQCVSFLQNWPDYPSDVAKTKEIFAKVDIKKLPSQRIINKAKTVVTKDLTNQEAWELYDCEPCQEIKKACLNAEGSFDAEKAKAIRSPAYRLMSRKDKVSLPKTIAQKAEAVEACLTIIDAYSAHEAQSKNLDKYLS